NGVKQTLTPQNLNTLEAKIGPEVTKQLQILFNSSDYQSLSDEEKSNAISSVVASVRKQVKAGVDEVKIIAKGKKTKKPKKLSVKSLKVRRIKLKIPKVKKIKTVKIKKYKVKRIKLKA